MKSKSVIPILQYSKNDIFIKKWGSISECADLGLDGSSISKVLRGKLKTTSNFKFKKDV